MGAVLFAGCASEGAPPGALPERAPPEVVEISPTPDSVIPDFDGDVRVRFDEPIQFGGGQGHSIQTSPAEVYQVSVGFSEIRVKPREGWREDIVYCFEFPEGITDLLRNRTESPIEFCFSTGPDVTETRVTGTITDRVTGQPVPAGRVLFLPAEGDTVLYSALTDQGGSFARRALPPGEYDVRAFRDRNSNFLLEPSLEAHDSARVTLDGPTATASLSFRLVEPDSTPPVLASVTAFDSLHLRLEFDDPMPRSAPEFDVVVVDTATGVPVPIAGTEIGEPQATLAEPDAAAEAADPAELTDTATAEGVRVERDTTRAPGAVALDTAAVGGPGPLPETDQQEPLPSAVATVVLGRALRAGTYRVSVSGVVNLRHLSGASDTTFTYEEPVEEPTEEPSTVPPVPFELFGDPTDTTAIEAAGAVDDTTGQAEAPPDSASRASEATLLALAAASADRPLEVPWLRARHRRRGYR